MPWFKKCIFWKNSLSPFWDPRGRRDHFRGREAKFWILSIFNGFSFRIFVILSFEVVWPQRTRRPQKGLREFFQKVHFWNQCVPTKKMRYVTALWSKRASLLGNEETHLVGDSTVFEIENPNLEQRSIFAKKSTLFYVRITILVIQGVKTSKNHCFEWFFPLYCF